MIAIVTVAPREIHDLVYRSSRAAGCAAGVAKRMAENITFAEIHHGAAVEMFVLSLAAGNLSASALANAPDALAAAEVEITARTDGETIVTFDPPVPLAGVAASIRNARKRGIHALDLDVYTSGAATIAALRLSTHHLVEPVDSADSAIRTRTEHAFRNGVALERVWLDRLDLAAAEFLVAESALDEIASED